MKWPCRACIADATQTAVSIHIIRLGHVIFMSVECTYLKWQIVHTSYYLFHHIQGCWHWFVAAATWLAFMYLHILQGPTCHIVGGYLTCTNQHQELRSCVPLVQWCRPRAEDFEYVVCIAGMCRCSGGATLWQILGTQ